MRSTQNISQAHTPAKLGSITGAVPQIGASTAKDVLSEPLPHNRDTERNILGAVILDNSVFPAIALTPDDFFLPEHKKIFQAMQDLAAKREPIEVISLLDMLTARNEVEAAGGLPYLSQLTDGLPRLSSVPFYVRLVKEDAMRRFAMHSAHAVILAGAGRDDVAGIKQRLLAIAAGIEAPDERAKTVSAKQLLTMKVKRREFLLDGLVTTRSMNEIFSWRGVGKTYAALAICHATATGGKFLKWQASRPRRVLFVDGELDAATLQDRLSSIGASDENLALLCADMQDDPFPNLATPRAQKMIERELDGCELLVLDNLSALAPSSNEREGEDWISIQSWLLELRRNGIASIFLHHAGHAGWSRGTTRREDLLDLVLELRRPKDYVASEGLRFELHFTKTRGYLASGAEPVEVRLGTDLDGALLWTHRDLEDARLAQIVELRDAGKSWREIESLTGIPRSTAERLYANAQK